MHHPEVDAAGRTLTEAQVQAQAARALKEHVLTQSVTGAITAILSWAAITSVVCYCFPDVWHRVTHLADGTEFSGTVMAFGIATVVLAIVAGIVSLAVQKGEKRATSSRSTAVLAAVSYTAYGLLGAAGAIYLYRFGPPSGIMDGITSRTRDGRPAGWGRGT